MWYICPQSCLIEHLLRENYLSEYEVKASNDLNDFYKRIFEILTNEVNNKYPLTTEIYQRNSKKSKPFGGYDFADFMQKLPEGSTSFEEAKCKLESLYYKALRMRSFLFCSLPFPQIIHLLCLTCAYDLEVRHEWHLRGIKYQSRKTITGLLKDSWKGRNNLKMYGLLSTGKVSFDHKIHIRKCSGFERKLQFTIDQLISDKTILKSIIYYIFFEIHSINLFIEEREQQLKQFKENLYLGKHIERRCENFRKRFSYSPEELFSKCMSKYDQGKLNEIYDL